MKRLLLWLLILCLPVSFGMAEGAAQPSVTVLAYVCGSDLEREMGLATADLKEMLAAGIRDDSSVRVLVETGGTAKWQSAGIPNRGLGRFELTEAGFLPLDTLPRANMGSADTLKDFLQFGLEFAPADRYILILWGHGGGATDGVCLDEQYGGDGLTMAELSEALENGLQGERLDGILFDACQMSCIEMAEVAAPHADYMVAGQDLTSGMGLRYDKWLAALAEDPGVDSLELYTLAAKTYVDDHRVNLLDNIGTMSVLDLKQVEPFSNAVNRLYGALDRRLRKSPRLILARRSMMSSFGEYSSGVPTDFVDAMEVAIVFGDLEPALCAKLTNAAVKLVAYNSTTRNMREYANGISLTMPYSAETDYSQTYTKETPYGRFILNMALVK